MFRKKIGVFSIAIALTASLLTGCTDANQKTASENTAKIVQVTEIDGTTITANVGELNSDFPDKSEGTPRDNPEDKNSDRGTPPDNPEDKNSDRGTPPEITDGENPDQGTPPPKPEDGNTESEEPPFPSEDMNENDRPKDRNGEPPAGGHGRNNFESSGESVTFTLTDSTRITQESPQGNEDASLEDITENSILEITLDSENQAEKIVIKTSPRFRNRESSQTETEI